MSDKEIAEVLDRQAMPSNAMMDVLIGAIAHLDTMTDVMDAVAAELVDPEAPELNPFREPVEVSQAYITELAVAGFFTPLTLKVQRPLQSNIESPGHLVYDQHKRLVEQMQLDEHAVKWYGDDLKMYVKARLWANGTLQLVTRVEDEAW